MMLIKGFLFLLLAGVLVAGSTSAQVRTGLASAKADSIREVMYDQMAARYPLLRQGFISTDFLSRGDMKVKYQGNEIFEGKANITRIRSNFTVPISEWANNRLYGNVSYMQQRLDADGTFTRPEGVDHQSGKLNKSVLGLSLAYSRSDTIFGAPVTLSASISGTTDEMSSIKRLTYAGTFVFPIRRSATQALSIGAVVIIDKANTLPVIPVISYWRKYQYSNLELFIDMPSRLALRKQLSKRTWVAAGSEIVSSLAFFNISQPFLPQNAMQTTVDIKTGATFEYLITRKLIVGINGGLFSNVQSRMFDSDKKANDYFLETNNKTVPYIGFSVSCLPFLKALK